MPDTNMRQALGAIQVAIATNLNSKPILSHSKLCPTTDEVSIMILPIFETTTCAGLASGHYYLYLKYLKSVQRKLSGLQINASV